MVFKGDEAANWVFPWREGGFLVYLCEFTHLPVDLADWERMKTDHGRQIEQDFTEIPPTLPAIKLQLQAGHMVSSPSSSTDLTVY